MKRIFSKKTFSSLEKRSENDEIFNESFDALNNNIYDNNNSGFVYKKKKIATGFWNDFNINVGGGYLKEIEEAYSTASIYQNYKFSKQFSDKFKLGLTTRVEYAKRNEIEKPSVKRWYDNSILKGEYTFNPFNIVSVFAGRSISDTTFTSYGASYIAGIETGDIEIKNKLILSYDYFYYWTQVSQNFIDESIEIKYKDFKFSSGYFLGVVDYNFIENYEATARNPNSTISFEAQYTIFSKPVVNAGFNFVYKDYKYRSPLYYSPSKRSVSGIFTNFFNEFGNIFLYLGGGIRIDNENVFIWDVDSEAGYDKNGFSVSVGMSRYNDPFYSSYNTFLNLSKSF
ncbi:MAG: hypothetical protein ABIY50_08360 [Ignavibacteria bacterium]